MKRLNTLLNNLEARQVVDSIDIETTDVAANSHKASKRALFVAIVYDGKGSNSMITFKRPMIIGK